MNRELAKTINRKKELAKALLITNLSILCGLGIVCRNHIDAIAEEQSSVVADSVAVISKAAVQHKEMSGKIDKVSVSVRTVSAEEPALTDEDDTEAEAVPAE